MKHLTPGQLAELRTALDHAAVKLERSMRATEEALAPIELDPTAVGRISRIDSLQN
jgi:hypothetical protein